MKQGYNAGSLKSRDVGSVLGSVYAFACNPDQSAFAGLGDKLPISDSLADRDVTMTINEMPMTGSGAWHVAVNPSNGVLFAAPEEVSAAAHDDCYTSTDGGDSWTARTLPGNITVKNLTTNGSSVFVLGAEDVVYSSTDGSSWSTGTLPSAPGGRLWKRLYWDGSRLVVVADGAQAGVGFSESATGVGSWSSAWSVDHIESVAISTGGTYLASGNSTVLGGSGTDTWGFCRLYKSTDGVSWNEFSYVPAITDYLILYWVNNKFVIDGQASYYTFDENLSSLVEGETVVPNGVNAVRCANSQYELITAYSTYSLAVGLYFRGLDRGVTYDHRIGYLGPLLSDNLTYDNVVALNENSFFIATSEAKAYRIEIKQEKIVKQQLGYGNSTGSVSTIFDANIEVDMPDKHFTKYVALRNGAPIDVPGRMLTWQPDNSYKECDGLTSYQTTSIELRKSYPKVTRTYRDNPVDYSRIVSCFCADGSTVYLWVDLDGSSLTLAETTNNGSSWTTYTPTGITGMISSMTKIGSTFYATRLDDWPSVAGSSDKLYTSTTPTTAWTERTMTASKRWLFVTNISTTIIAVAADGTVNLSTNSGATWSAGTSIGQTVIEVQGSISMGSTSKLFYNTGSTLYVTTTNGLYSTTDGTTWSLVFGMPCYGIAYNGKVWLTTYGISSNLTDWEFKSTMAPISQKLMSTASITANCTTPVGAIGEYFISQTGLFSRDGLKWFYRDDPDYRIMRCDKLGVLPLSSTTGLVMSTYPDGTTDNNPYMPFIAYVEIDDSVVQVPSSVDVPAYIKV